MRHAPAFLLLAVGPAALLAETVGFDDVETGKLPPGWQAGMTGKGNPRWDVVADPTAPSPKKVLRQSGEAAFPWCVKKDADRLAGESMAPGLHVGDVVLVNKAAYHLRAPFTEQILLGWSHPLRGEVVLVSVPAPGGGTMPAFKRVVGLSGDVVEVRDCRLIVNGREARYEPADPAVLRGVWPGEEKDRHEMETFAGRSYPVLLAGDGGCDDYGPTVIPEGRYFLLGDNRFNSRDSRYFRPLDRGLIVGRMAAVLSRAKPQGETGARKDKRLPRLPLRRLTRSS